MTCPALSPPVRNPDFGREGSGGPPGRPGAPRAPRAPPGPRPRGPPGGTPPGGPPREGGPGTMSRWVRGQAPNQALRAMMKSVPDLPGSVPPKAFTTDLPTSGGSGGCPPGPGRGSHGRARRILSQIGAEVGGGTHPPWTLNIGVGADRLRVSRPARVRSAPSTISPVETWTPGSRPSGGRAGSHLRGVRGVSPRSRVGGPREGTGHSGWGRPGGDLGGGSAGHPGWVPAL